MSDSPRLIAGAMSGTSADGVDVALTRITGRGEDMAAELVHFHHRPYSSVLREAIVRLRDGGQGKLADVARLTREIAFTYALAVNEALNGSRLSATDLAAVAAHGQTLFHEPPETMQMLDPALIAWHVGCPVVSDFRRADCAAGGQGAPLVPFADYVLFRDPGRNRVLLNIGGIANITFLRAGGALEQIVAYDTGPGNCLSDWICRTWGPPGMNWDPDGAGAMQGTVLQALARQFLSAPYFAAPPPKSTDGPQMIRLFKDLLGAMSPLPSMSDMLATATYVTAAAIQTAIVRLEAAVDEVIASGGGTRNGSIMTWLRSVLEDRIALSRPEDYGLKSEAKEAMAFALLGAATLDGVPANIPGATGAARAVVLGCVSPKP